MNEKKVVSLLIALCLSASITVSCYADAEINNSTIISHDPLGKLFIRQATGDINNCGPIAAFVARQFSTQRFKVKNLNSSIATARTLITPLSPEEIEDNLSYTDDSKFDSRWWHTGDIKRYLTQHQVPISPLNIQQGTQALLKELDKGNIMIINVNMNDLPQQNGATNIGKPYLTFPIPGGWGHFLVIVGYQYIDNRLVFQIHDSVSNKGKNRLFYAANIVHAVKRYSPEIIVINKGKSTTLAAK
ncbi:MAG TPA: hypothetical protein ENJ33_08260 [Thiothrix sp.]|nr:hypothetical protein [Thiothrix sp.]